MDEAELTQDMAEKQRSKTKVKIEGPGKYNTRNNRIVIIEDVKEQDVPRFSEGKPITIKETRAFGKLLPIGAEPEDKGERNFWRASDGGFGPNEGIGHAYDIVACISS